MQPELTLYHSPGACSRVSLCALEMAGASYQLRLVNFASNEQKTAAYRQISDLGKVPVLIINGVPMLENAAIITFAHEWNLAAGIFPAELSGITRAEVAGGLSFCGGTLHPQVRGIANPQRLTDGDTGAVRTRSIALAADTLTYAEHRLAERGWWLGERSIIDVYLEWGFSTAVKGGLDPAPFPHLQRLEEKLQALPAFVRMQELERESRSRLQA